MIVNGGAGKSGSFSDFRKAIGNNPSSEEAFLFVKEVLKKDIISKAKKEVSYASGADRPGERVAWGPASKYREVLERVKSGEDYNPDSSDLENGEFALVVFDWNDLGEFVINGTVSEEELLDFLLGGEGHSFGYSECPWGLYQCMLLCGLDSNKFIYVNTNEEFPGTPTTESVSEELEDKVWELAESDNYGHFYSWAPGWNPFE